MDYSFLFIMIIVEVIALNFFGPHVNQVYVLIVLAIELLTFGTILPSDKTDFSSFLKIKKSLTNNILVNYCKVYLVSKLMKDGMTVLLCIYFDFHVCFYSIEYIKPIL